MSVLTERLDRSGSVRFDEFVEHALYDEDSGFFATGGGAGRAGADFLTSPEVGPLFGAVVARYLDECWDELGRPDPFVVVESAAGRGALAIAVLAAEPRCAPALRYVLVERSAELRARQRDHLEVVEPFELLGPDHDPDDAVAPTSATGTGPLVTSLGELPSLRVDGVVLANELLDNVPFRLLERTAEGWGEVFVVRDRAGGFAAVVVPAEESVVELADRLAPAAVTGVRIPLQAGAGRWLRRALDVVDRGRLLVIDYCSTT
ncbi:MAG: SAM-dependent methyltransferase, partial [Actinomycetota bacterium]|nr:SAM-dependent methyltransferase [Actinomycetota bacterium]